jgi:hypothetical protein
VALAFGLAAASLFPALMMGIFSKRMNSAGATWGMLAGLISTCLYLFMYLGWFFIPGTAMLTADQYLFGIPPTHFGPIGALFNFGVAYLVSSRFCGARFRLRLHILHCLKGLRALPYWPLSANSAWSDRLMCDASLKDSRWTSPSPMRQPSCATTIRSIPCHRRR